MSGWTLVRWAFGIFAILMVCLAFPYPPLVAGMIGGLVVGRLRESFRKGMAGGITIVLLVALVAPSVWNLWLTLPSPLQEWESSRKVRLEGSVGLQDDGEYGESCEDLCLFLLYTRQATAVRVNLNEFRLEKREGCSVPGSNPLRERTGRRRV
jgi:hypothetical protein